MTALHAALLGITPPDALAHLRTLHARSTHPAGQDEAPIGELTYPGGNSPGHGALPGKEFVQDLIRAAQGQDQAWTSGADARAVAQVVDVADESSRSGQRIIIKGRVDEASAR